MSARKLAPIMAEMQPNKAQQLTEALSRKRDFKAARRDPASAIAAPIRLSAIRLSAIGPL